MHLVTAGPAAWTNSRNSSSTAAQMAALQGPDVQHHVHGRAAAAHGVFDLERLDRRRRDAEREGDARADLDVVQSRPAPAGPAATSRRCWCRRRQSRTAESRRSPRGSPPRWSPSAGSRNPGPWPGSACRVVSGRAWGYSESVSFEIGSESRPLSFGEAGFIDFCKPAPLAATPANASSNSATVRPRSPRVRTFLAPFLWSAW